MSLVTPDEELLLTISEILEKLDDSKPTHRKIADICFRCRALLRERFATSPSKREGGPIRDRAAYMRRYRAKQAAK